MIIMESNSIIFVRHLNAALLFEVRLTVFLSSLMESSQIYMLRS